MSSVSHPPSTPIPEKSDSPDIVRVHTVSARARTGVALVCGVAAGVVTLLLGHRNVAVLVGWDVTAAVFLTWVIATVMRYNEAETARHASIEDPSRHVADAILLAAAIASLIAIGVALVQAGNAHGVDKWLLVIVGIVSVLISWLIVQIVFTLRYARLFFHQSDGGIDFNSTDPGEGEPTYSDFAYVAFTIGMTFQVSDTNIKTKEIRAAALHHALVSYFFGVVIVGLAINLLAGLSSPH